MIFAFAVVMVALIAFSLFIYWDNIRIRRELIVALTHPPAVAGALLAPQKKAKKPDEDKPPVHPIGM